MKKVIFLLSALSFLLFAATAVAQEVLRYPVAELGYCRDAKECYLYCEIPENKAACWSYGKYVLGERVLGQHTDSNQDAVAKYGISFPIEELGNCASMSECRAFCEQPANQQNCVDFARKKGMGGYKKQGDMLERAKQTLGCDSFESCRAYCQEPANQEKCNRLAEEYAPEEFKARKEEMLQRARQVLGCQTFEECRNFCQNPNNQEKCMRFTEEQAPPEVRQRIQEAKQRIAEQAQKHGLPCDSFEACKAYCESNPGNCQRFENRDGQTSIQIHKEEELGCSTEEECRRLCEQNPDKCPGFKQFGEYERLQEEQKRIQEQQQQYQQQYQQYQENYQFEGSPSSSF